MCGDGGGGGGGGLGGGGGELVIRLHLMLHFIMKICHIKNCGSQCLTIQNSASSYFVSSLPPLERYTTGFQQDFTHFTSGCSSWRGWVEWASRVPVGSLGP